MIWPFRRKKTEAPETRNQAVGAAYLATSGQPVWSDFSIRNATKEGIKSNGWVFRCVSMIAKGAASAPWVVMGKDEEQVPGHALADLMRRPNPHISRQDLMELLTCWLLLGGNGYLYRTQAGRKTAELWPVAPDRLRPVAPRSIDEWVSGYALDAAQRATYAPEEIVHLKYLADPDNPLIGIGPLQAAAKSVDVDNAQRAFNASTSQNRGVIDGVFSFDRPFANLDEADGIAESIREKYGKKRGFVVLGSNGKYERVAMTPAEMDFTESRKANRDEIAAIFGVPLALLSPDMATYSNLLTSELMLYTLTIIPLLDDIADTLTHNLQSELPPDARIAPDIAAIPAIRRARMEQAKTAEMLSRMGVPFDRINRALGLGIDEYEGWDKPLPTNAAGPAPVDIAETGPDTRGRAGRPHMDGRRLSLSKAERRAEAESDAEERNMARFIALLEAQRSAVFDALPRINGIARTDRETAVRNALSESGPEWEAALLEMYTETALEAGPLAVIRDLRTTAAARGLSLPKPGPEYRAEIPDGWDAVMRDYFDHEAFLLAEKSHIEDTTITQILAKVSAGLEAGLGVNAIQETIIDAGIFEPSRALRLSRTLTGTAGSIGQHSAAKYSGATHKTWHAGIGARTEHRQRNDETVEIDGRFSPKFGEAVGPRYPLDPYLPPADRVNCRCSMSFEIRD